ncbi:MAG: hypothetical protein J6D47_20725 [Peptostreptococcaceae bacterium]|jgi:hypothetical protein|nr:hypothetical protein [Peptostreptococcaceae bacterium]
MSKKITYSGILLGLNIVLLLISNLISINTMFFMGLASLIISVIVMEYGVNTGVVFYIASIILSFVVMPNKAQWLLYILTFGIYGLVKYFIEKGRPIYTEIILKLIFANLVAVILYLILKNIVIIPINIITIIVYQVAFLVYDYVYSLFIEYYNEKIKRIINIK